MFRPLPSSMPILENVVRHLDTVSVNPPPPITDIASRLRIIFTRARLTNYTSLTRSQLRKLPYAYWLEGQDSLPRTDPDLVRLYWESILPQAILVSPRRAKRWLLPLFYIYCEMYDRSSEEFQLFSKKLTDILNIDSGTFAEHLRDLNNKYSFFNPKKAPELLASKFFLEHEQSIEQVIQKCQLWDGYISSQMGDAILKSSLMLSALHLGNDKTVSRIIYWARSGTTSIVNTGLRVDFANALIRRQLGNATDRNLKNILIKYFLDEYQDPRIPSNRAFNWSGVSEQALATFLNWLTGDTLQAFMKILRYTADDIWEYRQKFWMAYYNNGYIDEAWIALGDDAQRYAKELKVHESGIGFGRLKGAAATNQSVLILKIGDLIFTEWSHNGSLRAYHDNNGRLTPKLYKNSYDATDLRAALSLDFHNGANIRNELTHSHSSLGTWQRKARDFIRRNTNVYLRDDLII